MRGNFLDRAIGVFAPERAARRIHARIAIDAMEKPRRRDYDAASTGRRTGGWKTAGGNADSAIERSGEAMRERMRSLVRNDPYAAKAVATLVGHIIGDGIMPRAKTGDIALDKKINTLFAKWAKSCDADGQLDFYGLQTLMVREMVEGGEVIVRKRLRAKTPGVPLQLQILEADHIDSAKTLEGKAGQATISQGIELAGRGGGRAAYWLFPQHPGSTSMLAGNQSIRVPAADICHVYEKQRTQLRGVPWGAPVMTKLRDLGEYEDAEIMRKKLEACFVGVVVEGSTPEGLIGLPVSDPAYSGSFERNEDGTPLTSQPGVVDASGQAVEQFEPGMFAYARGGRDIKFNSPSQTGDYGIYTSVVLHAIAAGFRVPYELLTGDLSKVSFISGRMGLLEFKRFVSTAQWQIVIPMALDPIWQWFCDAAYLAGEIKSPDVPVEWAPPKWSAIDPEAEAKADRYAIRTGTKTLAEVIAENGRDPDAVLAEIAEINKKLDAAGIILEADPRKTTQNGAFQVDPKAQPAPAAGA